jgi:hypothetical protein
MNDDLLKKVREYFAQQQRPKPQQPLPPNISPEDSEPTRETACELYFDPIMRKDAGSWTPEEREFIRGSIRAYEANQ